MISGRKKNIGFGIVFFVKLSVSQINSIITLFFAASFTTKLILAVSVIRCFVLMMCLLSPEMNIKVIFVIHKSFSAVFKMSIDVCVSEVSALILCGLLWCEWIRAHLWTPEHLLVWTVFSFISLNVESSIAKRWQESIKSVKSPWLEIQKQSQCTNTGAVFFISSVFYITP